MNGYVFHPEVYTDLSDLWEFIATDSPDAADHVQEEIHRAILNLVIFPRLGHPRPDLTGRAMRFINVHDYLIAYAPNETPLLVLAVVHGRRDPRVLAAILRGREQRRIS